MAGRTVYSTGKGRICPKCGWPVDRCACSKKTAAAPSPARRVGPVRVRRETKGRKGKGVTVVTGLPLGSEEMSALARDLKKRCGSGGTVKEETIEIQGDHRDQVVAWLAERGFEAKKAGG